MNLETGFLVLESGECFIGQWPAHGCADRAGEVVFNTSHSGYEEMATDPSYMNQILVLTAPQQGNYAADDGDWESARIWIEGFVCVEMQRSRRDSVWLDKLARSGVPVLCGVDTRALVLTLREKGTTWGALVRAATSDQALARARELIAAKRGVDRDWAHAASVRDAVTVKGDRPEGPRVAVLDFGCKRNIIRELKARCSEVRVFPARASAASIRDYNPDGILLSNGPGDPADVQVAPGTVRELIGWKFMFGICMGHQILGLALGGRTYKLKFGHRGSNHPIRDSLLNKIYISSQNHGYALDHDSLPGGVEVTHINLNDGTVAGIHSRDRKIMGVQFHPESHPGPHDASELFDHFVRQTL